MKIFRLDIKTVSWKGYWNIIGVLDHRSECKYSRFTTCRSRGSRRHHKVMAGLGLFVATTNRALQDMFSLVTALHSVTGHESNWVLLAAVIRCSVYSGRRRVRLPVLPTW